MGGGATGSGTAPAPAEDGGAASEGHEAKWHGGGDCVECPICMEPFEGADGPRAPHALGCAHCTCAECWQHWTAVNGGRMACCPLCRHEEFLEGVLRAAGQAE